MQKKTIQALSTLTNTMYAERTREFSDSRATAWSGWYECFKHVPNANPLRVLDIGCGNGRFGKFLCEKLPLDCETEYVGIDANIGLLAEARTSLSACNMHNTTFLHTDSVVSLLAKEPIVPAPSTYDLISIFGVMHHIPSAVLREQLLAQAAELLAPNGQLWVSFWMFAEHDRFKKKMVDPALFGIDENDLEPGDFLISWDTATNPRYAHYSNSAEQRALVQASGLQPTACFSADGNTGSLNAYWVLTKT